MFVYALKVVCLRCMFLIYVISSCMCFVVHDDPAVRAAAWRAHMYCYYYYYYPSYYYLFTIIIIISSSSSSSSSNRIMHTTIRPSVRPPGVWLYVFDGQAHSHSWHKNTMYMNYVCSKRKTYILKVVHDDPAVCVAASRPLSCRMNVEIVSNQRQRK